MKNQVRICLISYCIGCLLLTSCGQSSSGSSIESGDIVEPVTAPSTTASPTPTNFPVVTEMPEITEAPQNTDAANITESPPATEAPKVTETINATAAPVITESPTFTEAPMVTEIPDTSQPTTFVPLRDNTPYCPVPDAPGTLAEGNEVTSIDVSHQADGYIMAKYFGGCPKVKMIIEGPNSYKCTYDLNSSQYQAFPLTAGDGTYTIGIYENIEGNSYATAYSMTLQADITDEFSPYLRPSQYVNYHSGTYAVSLASELCAGAANDLDCVTIIYNYIINNITYDHAKAENALSGGLTGYLPQIDESLLAGKGICVDYAAIMTCMLRTQRIPARLEVGYAGGAYHAWISTYITDIGWVNGIIQFDGSSWKLMDPTFGASAGEDALREFIGDGSNYTVKYIY